MENISIIFEQLKPFLAQMSEILGQGAEFSWKVAIKQQYVDGAIGLFFAILGIGLLVALAKNIKTILKWGDGGGSYSDRSIMVVFMILIPLVFGLAAFITGSIEAIQHFVNPEWQAIKDIADLVNPKIQQ